MIKHLCRILLIAIFPAITFAALTVEPAGAKWRGATLRYSFAESLRESQKLVAQSLIDHIETISCFKFVKAFDSTDPSRNIDLRFLNFRRIRSCSPRGVGVTGQQQHMNLNGCGRISNFEDPAEREQLEQILADYHDSRDLAFDRYGIRQTLQGILQVLGLYHEQRRPDRDSFVRVFDDRIAASHKGEYQMVVWSLASHQGLAYQLDSVMHNRRREHSTNGRVTIRPLQAVPIGSDHMTDLDIQALNRLYTCPGPAKEGKYRLAITNFQNFPTDVQLFVRLTAVGEQGNNHVIDSERFTPSDFLPVNMIVPPAKWQYVRIQIFGFFNDGQREVINENILEIVDASNHLHNLCNNPSDCTRNLDVFTTFEEGPDPCFYDPCGIAHPANHVRKCFNNGNFPICLCEAGYVGEFCESEFGRLVVQVYDADHLLDRDRFGGSSDSYARVTAVTRGGREVTMYTSKISSHSPFWNERLDFGRDHWDQVRLSVWDSDGFLRGDDDILVSEETFSINGPDRRRSFTNPSSCGRCDGTAHVNFFVFYDADPPLNEPVIVL